MRTRVRWALIVSTLTVAVTLAPASAASAATSSGTGAAPTTGCPAHSTFFIGVRGSGESATADLGMGSVYGAWRALRSDLGLNGGQGLTTVHTSSGDRSYPADSLDEVIGTKPNLRAYGKSISSGVAALDALIEKDRAQCSTADFILAGYSQGAMVIHDSAYVSGTKKVKIRAVLLAGDGFRQAADGGAGRYGGVPAADEAIGVLPHLVSLGIPAPHRLRGDVRALTVVLCKSGDLICDLQGAIGTKATATLARQTTQSGLSSAWQSIQRDQPAAVRAGLRAHTSYTGSDQDALHAIARFEDVVRRH